MASETASPSQATPAFRLMEATVASVHAAVRAGQLSCRELVQLYLDRIGAYDQVGPVLNSILTINPRALEDADRADAGIRSGGITGPLQGIPILVKDQLETDDLPTTYGSALFKAFVPERNATVVEKLRAAGAILLAKNTMSEYAQPGYYGSAFGVCRNPYDPQRSPAGSSCGTGASVAANFGVVGIGEDTGGSIRNPAAANCLVGLRPTLGLVSRFGVLPGTPTRDTLGPMTRTVADAAILLDVLAGYDPDDQVTAYSVGRIPPTYASFLTADGLRGKRLGVIREPIGALTNPQAEDYKRIWAVIDLALAELRSGGAELVDPLPFASIVELVRRPAGGGEAEEAINRYLAEHPNAPVHTLQDIVLSADGMVHPAQRLQLAGSLGRTTSDPTYFQAQRDREGLRQQVLKLMADHELDALVYPTLDAAQPLIPPDVLTTRTPDPRGRGGSALSPALGFPALAVPAGFTPEGWPVSLSFLGRPFTEGLLFAMAYGFEQLAPHREHPKTTPPLPGEP